MHAMMLMVCRISKYCFNTALSQIHGAIENESIQSMSAIVFYKYCLGSVHLSLCHITQTLLFLHFKAEEELSCIFIRPRKKVGF